MIVTPAGKDFNARVTSDKKFLAVHLEQIKKIRSIERVARFSAVF